MLFNSYAFIFFFLPTSFAVYFTLNRCRLVLASKAWLVFCSLFFYSYWNIRYLPLILSSITFNYAIGTALTKPPNRVPGLWTKSFIPRKAILYFGVAVNLLLLGYFKYSNFIISNMNHWVGTRLEFVQVTLPLGISFFTFTQIAYLVDSYRKECREYDFLNYGLFVTYFPHLIAGPIIHHKDLMPQFDQVKKKVLNYRNLAVGFYIFSIGLFKKVLLADTFAVWANAGFDHSARPLLGEAWVTALSYTFQLYFDFSGYIDMAIGASLLFNMELPINFYSPYKACTIQDFWRRWHITLSKFLRDYVYIPLGGNRRGEHRTSLNLFVTFLVGGLWHGANWTFVFWGALHGLVMVIQRAWGRFGFPLNRRLAWFLTFNFVNASWVFFRAKNWQSALGLLRGMAGLNGIALGDFSDFKVKVLWILAAGALVLFAQNTTQLRERFKPDWKRAAFTVTLAAAGIISLTKVSEFIYFNF